MRRLLLLTALSTIVAGAADAQPAAGNAPCRVAGNPRYGQTREHPIAVGGGPAYGAARQQRYLSFLRGPQGQPITYTRSASTAGVTPDTRVDIYTVLYDGIETPVTLFLDWYHFTEPMVPAGFGCAGPIELGTPPPDPFSAEDQLNALAAATAEASAGPMAPIPLGGDASVGFVLDRFRVIARRPPPGAVAPRTHRTVVVVQPRTCDNRVVPATAISLVNPNGQSAAPIELFTTATRFAALATGVDVADGSLGAVFQLDGVIDGVLVRATFPGCTSTNTQQDWPLAIASAELVTSPLPVRPADDESGASFVAVQAIIDHGGAFREARALGGPETLVRTALEAVRGWRARPPTANGAPLTRPVVLLVHFAESPAARR